MLSALINLYGSFVTKLFTYYVSIIQVPGIVADGPPFAIVENFHSASWPAGAVYAHASIGNSWQ